MALSVNDANIKEIISSNEYVLLDFGATWCGPCKAIAPIIEELGEEFKGKMAVGKVDVEESPEAAEEYGIRSVPSLIFFKNGEMQPELKTIGMTPKKKLIAKIETLMS